MLPTPYENNIVVAQDAERRRWMVFRRPVAIMCTQSACEVPTLVAEVEAAVAQHGYYAAGWLSYEAAAGFDPALQTHASLQSPSTRMHRTAPPSPAADFPRAWFGLYRAYDALEFPPPSPVAPPDWQPNLTAAAYHAALAKIKTHIQTGDSYQVNYTFKMTAAAVAGWPLFVQMVHTHNLAARLGYGVYVQTAEWTIGSASPELFFCYDHGRLTSRPMKGTAARGLGYADDRAAGLALRASAKNRAENIMVADMVRNDMGKIATVGSVQTRDIFALEQYPTFWSLTTTVQCQTTATIGECFAALFPAASITGAPKVKAVQIITELEPVPRHIYTGALGFFAPPHRAQFNVAIRTLLIERATAQAEFGVGGGIVWDSQPHAEWRECHTKARVVTEVRPKFALLATLRWRPRGGYQYLPQHLERLRQSAEYFSRAFNRARVHNTLLTAATQFPMRDQQVRVQLAHNGAVDITTSDYVPLIQPYRVRLAAVPVRDDCFLYHKTTVRHHYDAALRAAGDYDDVLLWNTRGEVTESCRANLIVERAGCWLTPPLTSGLLNGVARQAWVAAGYLRETVIRVADLPTANVWLLNSVRQHWRVVVVLEGAHART